MLRHEEEILRLLHVVRNIIRAGRVVQVNEKECTACVEFVDIDKVVSCDLPVVMKKTMTDKSYWMPEEGENVVCIFLPYEAHEMGFILGSFYSNRDATPEPANKNRMMQVFEDGSLVYYDKALHMLHLEIVSMIVVSATRLSVTADLNIKGNVAVDGDITATGRIIDGKGNTTNHNH